MKKKIKVLALIVLFVAVIAIVFSFLKKTSNKTEKPSSISKQISLITDSSIIEKQNIVSKVIGPAGGVLSIRAKDGTLYTLTVPPNALIEPVTVSLKTLSKVPFKNYGKADLGKGVYIGEKAATFNRPAYLTIQPNTVKPKVSSTGAVAWGRANIGSRGYDPEVSAAIMRVPLGAGIDPGKVVIYGSLKFSTILLNPTIPTGLPNTYNAIVMQPGFYMADVINKADAELLAKKTFSGASDYYNETEVLMHLAALGGDLNPFEDEIKRFANSDRSYPREVIKGAVIAKLIGNEDVYSERLKDLATKFESNLRNLRGSFLPWPRYAALYKQLTIMQDKQTSSSSLIATASAKNEDERFWPDELPDFDKSNTSTKDTSPEGSFPISPPELPDYIEEPASKTGSESAAVISDALAGAAQAARDAITSRFNSCNERVEAIETLGLLGMVDPANDIGPIKNVLEECAEDSSTIEAAEKVKNAAEKYGADKAIEAANARIKELRKKAGDCKTKTQKDLSNYGQNDCE